MIRITSVDVAGWKGVHRRIDFTSGLVVVEGENGTGKSAVSEALDFVLGRRIAGEDHARSRRCCAPSTARRFGSSSGSRSTAPSTRSCGSAPSTTTSSGSPNF